ncbi:hypothetical protein Sjap_010569 [Stephania japonica]|uniref:Uncharacterized protein n=1 Tax=Stephania japonica TaxID=461633 RepID=A0AAP0JBV8_9MAGN
MTWGIAGDLIMSIMESHSPGASLLVVVSFVSVISCDVVIAHLVANYRISQSAARARALYLVISSEDLSEYATSGLVSPPFPSRFPYSSPTLGLSSLTRSHSILSISLTLTISSFPLALKAHSPPWTVAIATLHGTETRQRYITPFFSFSRPCTPSPHGVFLPLSVDALLGVGRRRGQWDRPRSQLSGGEVADRVCVGQWCDGVVVIVQVSAFALELVYESNSYVCSWHERVDVILKACVPHLSSCASVVTLPGKSQRPLSISQSAARARALYSVIISEDLSEYVTSGLDVDATGDVRGSLMKTKHDRIGFIVRIGCSGGEVAMYRSKLVKWRRNMCVYIAIDG